MHTSFKFSFLLNYETSEVMGLFPITAAECKMM